MTVKQAKTPPALNLQSIPMLPTAPGGGYIRASRKQPGELRVVAKDDFFGKLVMQLRDLRGKDARDLKEAVLNQVEADYGTEFRNNIAPLVDTKSSKPLSQWQANRIVRSGDQRTPTRGKLTDAGTLLREHVDQYMVTKTDWMPSDDTERLRTEVSPLVRAFALELSTGNLTRAKDMLPDVAVCWDALRQLEGRTVGADAFKKGLEAALTEAPQQSLNRLVENIALLRTAKKDAPAPVPNNHPLAAILDDLSASATKRAESAKPVRREDIDLLADFICMPAVDGKIPQTSMTALYRYGDSVLNLSMTIMETLERAAGCPNNVDPLTHLDSLYAQKGIDRQSPIAHAAVAAIPRKLGDQKANFIAHVIGIAIAVNCQKRGLSLAANNAQPSETTISRDDLKACVRPLHQALVKTSYGANTAPGGAEQRAVASAIDQLVAAPNTQIQTLRILGVPANVFDLDEVYSALTRMMEPLATFTMLHQPELVALFNNPEIRTQLTRELAANEQRYDYVTLNLTVHVQDAMIRRLAMAFDTFRDATIKARTQQIKPGQSSEVKGAAQELAALFVRLPLQTEAVSRALNAPGFLNQLPDEHKATMSTYAELFGELTTQMRANGGVWAEMTSTASGVANNTVVRKRMAKQISQRAIPRRMIPPTAAPAAPAAQAGTNTGRPNAQAAADKPVNRVLNFDDVE